MVVGLVAFAFGIVPDGCTHDTNFNLASLASNRCARLVSLGHMVVTIAEWQVADYMERAFNEVVHIRVGQFGVLQTEAVVAHAIAAFAENGVTRVEVIAHAMQWPFIWWLFAREGWYVKLRLPGRVGFSPQSTQWRDRSAIHFTAYIIYQLFSRRLARGKTI